MTASVESVRVGDVLRLERRTVDIDPLTSYTLVGIYSFGKGIFHRDPKRGVELGSYRFHRIEPGDLVLSNIQAWEGAIAVAGMRDAGSIGTHRFLTYVPRDGRVDTNYIRYLLLSEPGMERIRRASPGSIVRNRTLGIDAFESIEICLPRIDEQRRVAARLDALLDIAGRLSTVARWRAKTGGALFEAILSREFASLEDVSVMGLGRDIEIVSGATPDSGNPTYWDGDLVWITPTDLGALKQADVMSSARKITQEGFDSCSTQWVPPGAVVMSSRAPIGHLGVARVQLCTNQGCKSFVPPDGLLPEYLRFALQAAMPRIRAAGSGTTFNEVSVSKLRTLSVPAPPVSVQLRLVDRLQHLEEICSVLNRRQHRVLELSAALRLSALNAALC
ncbi:MAG: restriction endonuclease subunit S [Mycobacteriales bacterium]